MKAWQIAVMAMAVTGVAVTAGFAAGRRPAPVAPLAAPHPPPAAAPAPVPERSPEAMPTPDPSPVAATPAPKPGASSLPVDLAARLKLTAPQSEAVEKAMKEWTERYADLNKRSQEAMAKAADAASKQLVRDQWSLEFDRLKGDRTAAILGSLTPEQQSAYREYRDKQYGAWLDGKVNGLSVMAKHALKATDAQVEQMKPLFREAVDGVTAGGTVTPGSMQIDGAQQALLSRLQGVITPEQAEAMERYKRTFRLY